jgi:hypothetical protein
MISLKVVCYRPNYVGNNEEKLMKIHFKFQWAKKFLLITVTSLRAVNKKKLPVSENSDQCRYESSTKNTRKIIDNTEGSE